MRHNTANTSITNINQCGNLRYQNKPVGFLQSRVSSCTPYTTHLLPHGGVGTGADVRVNPRDGQVTSGADLLDLVRPFVPDTCAQTTGEHAAPKHTSKHKHMPRIYDVEIYPT